METATIGGRRTLFVMATEHEYGPQLRARCRPLVTGVGPIEAAIGTTACLAACAAAGGLPERIVSLGSAGSRRCTLGQVYQVESVSWRDMDASALGFERGVTPFCDHPARISLPTPLPNVPVATLSTGADIVSGTRYDAIHADLVDMETFAVVRAASRFAVPVIGLRGVSDGPDAIAGLSDWTALLGVLDARLAQAVDALSRV
ncbi:MAG: 5'-methylthioadenosine/S-adenosylhomocysteine nucleosidase [Sphingomonas adhaesiva]|uniref:5'-methylthioadenosine/S-adenosylhomocysteine nucleosidase n=1 Tax=Sphingomonas adhaesiva TaxID=28212 RepID=UPI002FFBA899